MAWCFSTRASVATVLTMHPCVSRCLRVKTLRQRQNCCHFHKWHFQTYFLNENVGISLHRSLFLRCQLTIFQNWFRKWLGADQVASHYLNQRWLLYWCIYASLGLNELILICNSFYHFDPEPNAEDSICPSKYRCCTTHTRQLSLISMTSNA